VSLRGDQWVTLQNLALHLSQQVDGVRKDGISLVLRALVDRHLQEGG
jgi:hypothetical protein